MSQCVWGWGQRRAYATVCTVDTEDSVRHGVDMGVRAQPCVGTCLAPGLRQDLFV